jgi:hypothetical protein
MVAVVASHVLSNEDMAVGYESFLFGFDAVMRMSVT